jgi:hypothetical protein
MIDPKEEIISHTKFGNAQLPNTFSTLASKIHIQFPPKIVPHVNPHVLPNKPTFNFLLN